MNWREKFRHRLPSRETLQANRWLRWLAPWLGHRALWHWSRRGVALGVALGVFFGLLIPIAQIPVSAAAAVVLRANLPAAVASTLITNPVTFGPVYYAAYKLGSYLTGETTPLQRPAVATGLSAWQRIAATGKPLLVGLALMACIGALVTYLVIHLAWSWRTGQRWRNRKGLARNVQTDVGDERSSP